MYCIGVQFSTAPWIIIINHFLTSWSMSTIPFIDQNYADSHNNNIITISLLSPFPFHPFCAYSTHILTHHIYTVTHTYTMHPPPTHTLTQAPGVASPGSRRERWQHSGCEGRDQRRQRAPRVPGPHHQGLVRVGAPHRHHLHTVLHLQVSLASHHNVIMQE